MTKETKPYHRQRHGAYLPSVIHGIIEEECEDVLQKINESTWQSKKERYRRKLLVEQKYDHTFDVIKATVDIIHNMKYRIEVINDPWNPFQAVTIAALHDLGRFQEARHLGTYNRAVTGYPHAEVGVDYVYDVFNKFGMFHETFFIAGIDGNIVRNAVLNHDKRELVEDEPYLKLIRDADQLANLRHIKEQLKPPAPTEDGSEYLLTPEVVADLKAGKLVDGKNVHTFADSIIYQLAWLSGINFEATKRIVKRENIIKQLLDLLIMSDEIKQDIITSFLNIWDKRTETAKLDEHFTEIIPAR